MVAFFMVILIAALGLAVDGGNLFFLRRDAQGALDNALMAGAQSLCANYDVDPGDRATRAMDAAELALRENGFEHGIDGVEIVIHSPPQAGDVPPGDPRIGNPDVIYVSLKAENPALFIQIVSEDALTVTVDGTGHCDSLTTNVHDGLAIAAVGTTCSQQFQFSGASFTLYGGLHSNSNLHVSAGSPINLMGGHVSYRGRLTDAATVAGPCNNPWEDCWLKALTIDPDDTGPLPPVSGQASLSAYTRLPDASPTYFPLRYHMDDFRPQDTNGDPVWPPDFSGPGGTAIGGDIFESALLGNNLWYFGPTGVLVAAAGTYTDGYTDWIPYSDIPTYSWPAGHPFHNVTAFPEGYFRGSDIGGSYGPYIPEYGLVVVDTRDFGSDGIFGTADDVPPADVLISTGTTQHFNSSPSTGWTLVSLGKINISGNGWTYGVPTPSSRGLSVMSWFGAYTNADGNPGLEDISKDPWVDDYQLYGSCNDIAIASGSPGSSWAGLVYAPFAQVNVSMGGATNSGQIIAYQVNVSVGTGSFRWDADLDYERQLGIRISD